jgi:hypothetical protein
MLALGLCHANRYFDSVMVFANYAKTNAFIKMSATLERYVQ